MNRPRSPRRRRPTIPAILLSLAAAACASPPDRPAAVRCEAPAAAAADRPSCADRLAALPDAGAPLAPRHCPLVDRVVRPGEAVTMDFNPQRLTVRVDDGGRIEEKACK
ncbi:I78 family peptidase inhibitor [Azospirillum sp. ST 5-10]|uniref:I78 family peptidase inhibitor n=1 Tax=unclassified Azospirillum TaxID=2630922 RepID=UPI003F49E6A9